ncbi:MAG TPA: DUF1178 family protein [Casimicrobiaceae bacterium]
MIVYDLVCAQQHRFEGWFGSAEDFTRQRDDALIRCPLCDDAAIERRPSANIQVGRAPVAAAKAPAPVAEPKEASVAGIDAEALKLIRRLVSETENVGRAFPEEARKIHYEEAPRRGIRGQATHEEAHALREEGIEFMSLPALLTRDLN